MTKRNNSIIDNRIKIFTNMMKDNNLKKWLFVGFTILVITGLLSSCSPDSEIPEQNTTPTSTQEQPVELVKGEHTLKVGNLQDADMSDLISKLPEKYANNYTTFGNEVRIFGIEDADLIYFLDNIDYPEATYYIQSKDFSIHAIGITLNDVNNYIRNADIRYGEAELLRIDDNYYLNIEGIANYKDRDTVMSILQDAECIQGTYDSSTRGYTKDFIYEYINIKSNTLEVRDLSDYPVFAGDYLDLQNPVLDRIVLESGYVLYSKD